MNDMLVNLYSRRYNYQTKSSCLFTEVNVYHFLNHRWKANFVSFLACSLQNSLSSPSNLYWALLLSSFSLQSSQISHKCSYFRKKMEFWFNAGFDGFAYNNTYNQNCNFYKNVNLLEIKITTKLPNSYPIHNQVKSKINLAR